MKNFFILFIYAYCLIFGHKREIKVAFVNEDGFGVRTHTCKRCEFPLPVVRDIE